MGIEYNLFLVFLMNMTSLYLYIIITSESWEHVESMAASFTIDYFESKKINFELDKLN